MSSNLSQNKPLNTSLLNKSWIYYYCSLLYFTLRKVWLKTQDFYSFYKENVTKENKYQIDTFLWTLITNFYLFSDSWLLLCGQYNQRNQILFIFLHPNLTIHSNKELKIPCTIFWIRQHTSRLDIPYLFILHIYGFQANRLSAYVCRYWETTTIYRVRNLFSFIWIFTNDTLTVS